MKLQVHMAARQIKVLDANVELPVKSVWRNASVKTNVSKYVIDIVLYIYILR